MSFDRLRGQERLTSALREAIRCNRLAHALLIVGPPGSGKRTLAREVAKALLCTGRTGAGEGCDACRDCRLVEHDNHPDFGFFARDAEHSSVHVETARALQADLALKPFSGRRKVAALPEAHLLNEAAANCLLKTLEEPPGNAVVMLLADSAAEILPTILSRCQVFKMEPLPPALLAEVLEREHGIEADRAAYAAAMAGGSLGRALELASPDWYDMKRFVVESFTGVTPATVFEVSDELASRVRRLGGGGAAYREALCRALDFAAALFRDAAACRAVAPIHADQVDRLPRHLTPETAAGMADRVFEAQAAIQANVNPGLVLDALLLEIADLHGTG